MFFKKLHNCYINPEYRFKSNGPIVLFRILILCREKLTKIINFRNASVTF